MKSIEMTSGSLWKNILLFIEVTDTRKRGNNKSF